MIRATLISLALMASPAWAELRPAPAYFVDVIVDTAWAQQLAQSCPEVSVDPVVLNRVSEHVLQQLNEDGFDVNAEDMGMTDARPAIRARQEAFLAKHQLADGASTEAVCAVARAEMEEGTEIGSYLVEVPQ